MRNRRRAPVFFRSAAPPLLNALPPARVAGFSTTPCCFFHLSRLYIYSCEAAYYLFCPASLSPVFAIRIQYYTVSSTLSSLVPFRFSLLPRQSCVKRLSARRLCVTLLSAGMRIRPCSIFPGTPLPAFFCIKKPHALFGARGFARFRSVSLGWDVGDHLRREFRDTHALHPDLTRALEHCQKQPFTAKQDVLKAPHHLRAVAHRRLI